MAESRNISIITQDAGNVPIDHLTVVDTHLLRWKGVTLTPTNDGVVLFIPRPQFLLRSLIKKLHRFKNRLFTMLWPAPAFASIAGVGGFMSFVVSNDKSWWRTGPLADVIWGLDERFNPLKDLIPRHGRVAYLTGCTTLAGLIVLMSIQRSFLRILLRYRGWMYESKPTLKTIVWAGILKVIYAPQRMLGAESPLLYSYQKALPALPVPPLEQTISKYLASVQPLMDEKEFESVTEQAAKFKNTVGKKLQFALQLKRWLWAPNYVSDWWVKYVYLKGRYSLLINSNYYGMGLAFARPCSNQLARAAVLTHNYVCVQEMVHKETLEPMMLRNTVPLCMAQYQLLFGTTRIPYRDCDALEQFDENPRHIIVTCLGQYFSLETRDPKTHEKLSIAQFYEQFKIIQCIAELQHASNLQLAEKSNDEFPLANEKIALMTTAPRDKWAELRERYMLNGVNRSSLQKVESAAFIVALDDKVPSDWSEQGLLQLHGDGCDRWTDKSLTLVVFKNGVAGVHAEHTWGDAPVIAHSWELVLAQEARMQPYTEAKDNIKSEDENCLVNILPPTYLRWNMHYALQQEMRQICNSTTEAIENLRLKVFCFGQEEGEFGKGRIKKNRISPDGFIQMALQLAYRKDAGKNCLTYEAGMTRLYNEGRTETVRSLSNESSAFVDLMFEYKKSPSEALKLKCRDALKVATAKHSLTSKDAMAGNGIDRHLFALYVVGKGLGYVDEDIDFVKSALSIPWTMSTSQLPQRQTHGKWPAKPNQSNMSPSGGFGPVADTGYGISYMIAGEDHLFFHVSSKCKTEDGENTTTSSERFAEYIRESLLEMLEIYES